MKLQLAGAVLSPAGKPFEKSIEDKSPISAGALCMKAVLDCKSSSEAAASVKFERGMLAAKLMAATDDTDFSVDEVKTIKDATGEAYGPWIVMQVWNILEGKGQANNAD